MKEKELLEKLTNLYNQYAKEHRSSIQPVKMKLARERGFAPRITDQIIREGLIEHIGVLPVIATTVHPYLKDSSIDLGEVLIMLAIHDIGELKVGDQPMFLKEYDNTDAEKQAALQLLDSQFHELYLDMEEQRSDEGRFAKAIDKLSGDILDLACPPDVNIERYAGQGIAKEEIVPGKREKKFRFFEWNPFLKGFYEYVLRALEVHFSG